MDPKAKSNANFCGAMTITGRNEKDSDSTSRQANVLRATLSTHDMLFIGELLPCKARQLYENSDASGSFQNLLFMRDPTII